MPILSTTIVTPYRLEKPIHNSQMGISFQAPWRQVPLVLHEMKRVDLSICKAKVIGSWTTLYIKSADPMVHAAVHHDHIVNVLQGRVLLDHDPLYHSGLDPNTQIHLYNLANYPYTALYFSCPDRVGLFCEILEFLAPYDIQIHRAYCNAQQFITSNIFFITNRQGQLLSPEEMDFFRNLFEYDLKKRLDVYDNTY